MSRRLILALALLCACGGSSRSREEHLECSFFEEENCWTRALDEVTYCAPNPMTSGTFATGRLSCLYDGGAQVTFGKPPPEKLEDLGWDFTLTNQGNTCARYEEGEEAGIVFNQLITRAGIVRMDRGEDGVAVTCPDGARHVNPEPLAIASCSPWRKPTLTEGGNLRFELGLTNDADSDREVLVFECAPPPEE